MSDLYTGKVSNSQIASNGGVSGGSIQNNDIGRTVPRTVSTGIMRGTQGVGTGGTKIDSSNNRITLGNSIVLDGNSESITVTNTDGTVVGMGLIPDSTDFGFYGTYPNGNLAFKYVNGTWFYYDPTSQLNYMQNGLLPDGTGGWSIAQQGYNVSQGY